MMKLKGCDNSLKCGLAEQATLRVIVQVLDPTSSKASQCIKKVLSFEQDQATKRATFVSHSHALLVSHTHEFIQLGHIVTSCWLLMEVPRIIWIALEFMMKLVFSHFFWKMIILLFEIFY